MPISLMKTIKESPPIQLRASREGMLTHVVRIYTCECSWQVGMTEITITSGRNFLIFLSWRVHKRTCPAVKTYGTCIRDAFVTVKYGEHIVKCVLRIYSVRSFVFPNTSYRSSRLGLLVKPTLTRVCWCMYVCRYLLRGLIPKI